METRSLLPQDDAIALVDATHEDQFGDLKVCATRDHELIRRWAARHQAEPATGEATDSGPSTLSLNDGGAAIRFNFPAADPFRTIEWDEWFRHFDTHALVFVYERDTSDSLSYRYRLLPMDRLSHMAELRT
jgi:hypothetical protein